MDTAGWLQRAGKEKGPASLSIMQSRKNLMRAHIIALVLDAEEVSFCIEEIHVWLFDEVCDIR